jgi:hypothetical protein
MVHKNGLLLLLLRFSIRIEQTIGKPSPTIGEDRSKSTILARVQRIEGTMGHMGQTIEQIHSLVRNMDDKFDRLMIDNHCVTQSSRATRSATSNLTVKFSSIQEEIP